MAHVSLELLRQQNRELQEACRAVENARKSIQRQYRQLGNGWNDEKYRALGRVVEETVSALNKLEKVFQNGRKTLAVMIATVSEYETIRIILGSAGGNLSTEAANRIASASDPTNKPGYSELGDQTRQAMDTAVEDRTWSQTERADAARHANYATQLSFTRDEDGNIVPASHGARGTQRPDGIRRTDNGVIDIREDKDYHDVNSLLRNMASQAADRYMLFGADTELTFVVAANEFTAEDADTIRDYVVNVIGASVEWILK